MGLDFSVRQACWLRGGPVDSEAGLLALRGRFSRAVQQNHLLSGHVHNANRRIPGVAGDYSVCGFVEAVVKDVAVNNSFCFESIQETCPLNRRQERIFGIVLP